MKYLCLYLLLAISLNSFASEQPIRYRGHYTYGHEVNAFCPIINSQCYWLSPETNFEIREQLKKLSINHTSKPYEAICIVVEGAINRDPMAKKQTGFAEQYDGLFTATRLFGLCNKTSVVTQGDLQHHRWILESVNNIKIDVEKLNNKIPELDFGEHMTVSGNTGCNQFTAKAVLRDETFSLSAMRSTLMSCAPAQNELESLLDQILSQESKIIISEEKQLILVNQNIRLKFYLKDWLN